MARIELSPDFVNDMVPRLIDKDRASIIASMDPGTLQLQTLLRSSICGLLVKNKRVEAGLDPTLLPGLYDNGDQRFSTPVLYICKGIVPTDFSELDDATRLADALISYFPISRRGNDTPMISDFAPTSISGNIVTINTGSVPAGQSGTATWFWLTHLRQYGWVTEGDFQAHQIYGTIGVTGSGADLEIPSVDVVQGTAYRIINLRLRFPTSWEY